MYDIDQLCFLFQVVLHFLFVIVVFLKALLKFTSPVTGIENHFSLHTDSFNNLLLLELKGCVNKNTAE
jgi:hypothetical protein